MSACAALEKDTKKKAEPLEKKLDKRGLFDHGYGYGINGLDVGYVGNSQNGVYNSAPIYQSGYARAPYYHDLGHKVDIHRTITKTVGVPVPYQVSFLDFG